MLGTVDLGSFGIGSVILIVLIVVVYIFFAAKGGRWRT